MHTPRDKWYYPQEFEGDLKDVTLPKEIIDEILNTAWEYARTVIPHYTNKTRYFATVRFLVILTVVEFRGDLVDVATSDQVLGYNIEELLETIFGSFKGQARVEMGQEFRASMILTAEKASNHGSQTDRGTNSKLFRHYMNSLARSPREWFRHRDCDGLSRFGFGCVLACNDLDHIWFSEDQFEILSEIAMTSYDAVAFYKHRAEGETHNTFAFAGEDLAVRKHAFHRCREVLWRLDSAWANSSPELLCIINAVRSNGGTTHITMRRYRFVEDDLKLGLPEEEHHIARAQKNHKLWNRVQIKPKEEGGVALSSELHEQRYGDITSKTSTLLYPDLEHRLEKGQDLHCNICKHRGLQGTTKPGGLGGFVGVDLCESCKDEWQTYLGTLVDRAEKAFPVLLSGSSTKK